MSHLVDCGFTLTKQGAEARLYSGMYLDRPTIIKERFTKSYRHPVLDSTLNKERTKSEAKSILKSLMAGIRTPTIYMVDYNGSRIYMEHIQNSLTVKQYILDISDKIDEDPQDETFFKNLLNNLTHKIGQVIARLHVNNIIHGDLTTSNMLLAPPRDIPASADFNLDNGELVLLDFGLSHIDSSAEDKGVDLYVLERALTSTHNTLPDLFENILKTYKKDYKSNASEVIAKLEDVRARGRKRTMVG